MLDTKQWLMGKSVTMSDHALCAENVPLNIVSRQPVLHVAAFMTENIVMSLERSFSVTQLVVQLSPEALILASLDLYLLAKLLLPQWLFTYHVKPIKSKVMLFSKSLYYYYLAVLLNVCALPE